MKKLDLDKYPALKKLAAKGWQFWEDFDEHPHSGNVLHEFYFRSPRMDRAVVSSGFRSPTPRQLIYDEATVLIDDRYEYQVDELLKKLHDDIFEQLHRNLVKNPDVKIKLPKKIMFKL